MLKSSHFQWRNVDVYLATPTTDALQYIALLSPAEQQHAQAFRFAKDRELYIAAHVFLRRCLSLHAPLTPAAWQFSTNHYGKPFITNPGYEALQFNLSHTHGLIACAVVWHQPVGIDVEIHKPLADLESLTQYAFSTTEAQDVIAQPNTQQQTTRFFTYWTLKEAYIKARGMGLALPLQAFTFSPNAAQQWQVTYTAAWAYQDENWSFFSQEIAATHHLALAICAQN